MFPKPRLDVPTLAAPRFNGVAAARPKLGRPSALTGSATAASAAAATAALAGAALARLAAAALPSWRTNPLTAKGVNAGAAAEAPAW